jgi:hypothetical protein
VWYTEDIIIQPKDLSYQLTIEHIFSELEHQSNTSFFVIEATIAKGEEIMLPLQTRELGEEKSEKL